MNRRQFLRRRQPTLVYKMNRPIEHVIIEAETQTILVLTDQGAHRVEIPEDVKP